MDQSTLATRVNEIINKQILSSNESNKKLSKGGKIGNVDSKKLALVYLQRLSTKTKIVYSDTYPPRTLHCLQQRLLLLYHASKCTFRGKKRVCPCTPVCADIKKVWKHIMKCKDPQLQCSFPHCVSSR